MLNLTFNSNQYTDHDVDFYDVTNLPDNTDGTTRGENETTFRIELNANTLPHKSKEYILATVYHEILHAYLYSQYTRDGLGKFIMPDHHSTMADSYISLMTTALKTAFPNISNPEAWALSWGGLEETPFYTTELTSDQRLEIESINKKHKKSEEGTVRLGTYCN